MDNSTQTDFDIYKDIYAKLDSIQAVLGFILEKTNLTQEVNLGFRTVLPDNLDARDAEGTVLPV